MDKATKIKLEKYIDSRVYTTIDNKINEALELIQENKFEDSFSNPGFYGLDTRIGKSYIFKTTKTSTVKLRILDKTCIMLNDDGIMFINYFEIEKSTWKSSNSDTTVKAYPPIKVFIDAYGINENKSCVRSYAIRTTDNVKEYENFLRDAGVTIPIKSKEECIKLFKDVSKLLKKSEKEINLGLSFLK